MIYDPLFIGISILNRRHKSVHITNNYKSSEYYSSISEDSNAKNFKPDYCISPKTVITGREFEEKNFLPSDFSISSIREPQSLLTLTDSNEYRMNLLHYQNLSPVLMTKANEPFNNPSLFKKQNKYQYGHGDSQLDKENEKQENPKSSERKELKKKHRHHNSITSMKDDQWFGLKTSRVLSPQLPSSHFKHFI